MTYEWRFLEDTFNGFGRFRKFILYGVLGEKEVYVTIENGALVTHSFDENNPVAEPLFSASYSSMSDANLILQAMADGLKDMGYLQKINEEERIKEKALAEERKIELDYFKNLNTKLIESTIKE